MARAAMRHAAKAKSTGSGWHWYGEGLPELHAATALPLTLPTFGVKWATGGALRLGRQQEAHSSSESRKRRAQQEEGRSGQKAVAARQHKGVCEAARTCGQGPLGRWGKVSGARMASQCCSREGYG